MSRRAAATAMFLLVSACLLPRAGSAAEATKTIQIGHLGDKIETMIEISSSEGRMTATPLARIKEDPERAYAEAANEEEPGLKTVANIVPDGDISLSRGRKFIGQVREAIKKWKTDKAGSRNASSAVRPAGSVDADGAGEAQARGDDAGQADRTIDLCENCNFRLATDTSFQ